MAARMRVSAGVGGMLVGGAVGTVEEEDIAVRRGEGGFGVSAESPGMLRHKMTR